MTDDQSFVMTLFGLFWLLPLVIATVVGRLVRPRTAILTACGLLVALVAGAAWAYVESDGRAYGPQFAVTAYLVFVAGPVSGCAAIGLALGQAWRRKAGKSTDGGSARR